ncbi:hypothetical protein [uncultured Pontibacter sp.]|uniref:hypothetical protein n=1 Tax=uncultured Pontibacter sp. TaxID=453356 RepID=UPI0026139EB9|nr:hypothetical protein [uncultured Pontibacter sp.]
MKKLLYFSALILTGLFAWSCTPDLYQRPVTIDKLTFSNNAGDKYDYQFNRVNGWFLQKIETLGQEKHTFDVDTTARKRYRKYNYTLVASLDKLVIENQPGVYYQLYLRPNSGIGKLRGGVQDDLYNELKLFSPEENFLQHEQDFYTDSIVAGPFKRLITVNELYEPLNVEQPGIISFAIDSINFSKGFKKRQRESIKRLVNNTVVLMQRNNPTKSPNKGPAFNYYPNYEAKEGKVPASYVVNLNVSQDPISNKIKVSINSPGYTPDSWTRTDATFNRIDFLAGHDYEANMRLNMFVRSFIGKVYYAKTK